MTPDELHTHIETVRRLKTDTDTLEAKSAVGGLPQNLWRSLSAFSNTRGGSVVLGIEERTGNVVGVKMLQECSMSWDACAPIWTQAFGPEFNHIE